jgi:hypothetical protein
MLWVMITTPKIIFALVMGCLMSLSITLATTFVRVGPNENFFWLWFEVWTVAYPVAIISILIYRPLANKITDILFEHLRQK